MSRRVPPAPRSEWAYFFDIDGTLSELAASPRLARVDLALRQQLKALARATGGAVAVVSGRALRDIDALIDGAVLPAAGQHGAERRRADGRVTHAPAALRRAIEKAHTAVEAAIARHRGLLLEDKGYALALHYRAAPQLAAFARRVMRAQQAALGRRFALQYGKLVAELLPTGVNKGAAIRAFLAERPFYGRRPVFIGDDVTDEAGFAVVRARRGYAVKVGSGPSRAGYRLASVAAVGEWLASGVGGNA